MRKIRRELWAVFHDGHFVVAYDFKSHARNAGDIAFGSGNYQILHMVERH